MKANKELTIIMPVYNRADFLDASLEVHIPLAKKYNVEICIFDNKSTDHTEEVVSKWMKQYSYLSYHKNKKNIGPVKNFEKALKYPKTDYIWLLGDTYHLPDDGIDYLLNVIQITDKKYDAFVFNLENKLLVPTKDYVDSNLLLNELAALLTCAAVSVMSRELIENAVFERYSITSFPHTAIIFENIANKNFLMHWVSEHSVTSLVTPKLKKTNWSQTPKAFEIGCEDWTNFIMSLPPSYKLDNKMKCIMDFGKVSGLFTLKGLFSLRIQGLLNIKIFSKYKKLFNFTVDFPIYLIFILAVTPKIIFKLIRIFSVFLQKVKIIL